ncbi:MAG: HPr family phosphocarrier protein [Planctomycetota bacterium]
MEATRTLRIKNSAGLHARPCHAIVVLASRFESQLTVSCGDTEVNGKSILELMTLCAPCEATLSFRAHGRDADQLIAGLTDLVEAGFGELD